MNLNTMNDRLIKFPVHTEELITHLMDFIVTE